MKLNYNVFILVILFTITYISNLCASSKYAGAFLNNGTSARSIALGKTGFISNLDASSVHWNPALLNNLSGKNLSLMLSQPFEEVDDLQYHTIFYSQNLFDGKLGLGLIYLTPGDMKKTNNNAQVLGTFGSKDIAILSGYSRKWTEKFTAGANLKIIHQKIDSYSGTGFGADLGMNYTMQDNLNFAMVLKNLIPPMVKLNKEKETFPLRVEVGGHYNFIEPLGFNYGFSIESSEFSHHIGVEYSFEKILDVRLGYDEETESLTGGLGFKFKTINLDYSYKDHKDLGGTHIFSFNIVNF